MPENGSDISPGVGESAAALLVLIPRRNFRITPFGLHDAMRQSDRRLRTSPALGSYVPGIAVSILAAISWTRGANKIWN